MKTIRILSAVVFAALCASTVPAAVVDGLSDSIPPTPGVWNSNFSTSLDFALKSRIPVVTFAGRTSCTHCNTLIGALNTTTFKNWMVTRKPILIFKDSPAATWSKALEDADFKAADDWITAFGYVSELPEMNVYWVNDAGTLKVYSFSGSGYSASSLINLLDRYIGRYVPDDAGAPGEFVAGTTAETSLEANGALAEVIVPLKRASGSKARAERLVADYPDGVSLTNEVAWAVGEREKSVAVLQRWDMEFVGGEIALSLISDEDELLAESVIRYVEEREDSVFYPRWIGETLEYGVWTLDYAGAKRKVAADGGFIMALFTGTMWCPYCHGMETSLLADPDFTQWAKDNHVMLVSFDQGLASSPATAAGTDQARLLSYEAGADHLDTKIMRSGAYYLSGKGVDPDDAKERIAEITRFASFWRTPEATGDGRLGNPTMLFVKNDEVVVRVSLSRDASRVYDTTENLGRLDDALVLAASRDDEADDWLLTTERTVTVNGDPETCDFQISSKNKCLVLADAEAGVYTIRLDAPDGKEMSMALYSGSALLASTTEAELSSVVSLSQAADGLYLKISAYSSGTPAFGGETSRFSATVSVEAESHSSGGDEDGPGFDPLGRPCFGWEGYELNVWQGIASTLSFNVVNVPETGSPSTPEQQQGQQTDPAQQVKGGANRSSLYYRNRQGGGKFGPSADGLQTVSPVLVSGSLPQGLSLVYDAATKRVKLSGTATRLGTYAFSCAIRARINGSNVTGEPSSFLVTVGNLKTAMPELAKSRTTVMPLIVNGFVAGELSVSASSTLAISATYKGTAGSLTFNGSWQGCDLRTRRAFAVLTSTGGAKLELSFLAESERFTAEVSGPAKYSYFAQDDEFRAAGQSVIPEAKAFADWKGVYAVTFPVVRCDNEGMAGTAYLTLMFTSTTALRDGKVSYSGYLANGVAVSGTAVLMPSDSPDYALLPVFWRSTKDVFGAMLRIRKDAKDTWTETQSIAAIKTISAQEGNMAYHLHQESAYPFFACLDAYGRYFAPAVSSKVKPLDLVATFNYLDDFSLTMGVDGEVELGTVTATATTFELTAAKGGLQAFSYGKTTGVFTGTVSIRNSQGSTVKGSIRGTLMPGWADTCGCFSEVFDRPFGSGTLFYSDRINGRAVTVSIPVDINGTLKTK